jgi:hypothetical protein
MTATLRHRAGGLVDDLRAVILPWIVARLLISAGYITAFAIADKLTPGSRPTVLSEGLVAWDGTWYRDIAMHGYDSLPLDGLRFFPLFPLVGRALTFVTLGRTDVALVLIANVASLLLAVAVRRIVLFERGSEALARRSVWFVCLFPGAFVLAWAYAEAVWLLAAVAVMWAIRSRRWGWAILAGCVVGFTRPLGIVMVVPIAIELVRVWRDARRDERILGLAALASPALATGAYLLWVSRVFGDAWLPYSVQDDFRGQGVDPFTRIWDGVSQMFGAERFGDGLHIPFAIVFVILLVFTFRYWAVSYGAFAALVLFAALDAQNLNSLERYGLNAFPIVLTAAVLARDERVERVVTMLLAGGMVALCAMAWTGAYVP